MSLKHKIIFIFSLPAFIVSVIGCGISNQQIPLPTGALGYVPNLSKTGPAQIKLPYNQISIPFPYIDIFSNGTEQWDLEMDTSGKTILRGYWTSNGRSSENKEIAIVKEGDKCPKCSGSIKESKAIEVGNIFRYGTVYSQKMGVYYTDKDGSRKLVHFGAYGIGITRMIGTLVELFHDDRGIIWPKSVAPYQAHLIAISNQQLATSSITDKVYDQLQKENIEVLYDDREVPAGQKFADADLIGVPVRLVVSVKTGGKIEWKERASDKTELISVEEVIKRLKKDQAA